jgi:hypothetical protein
MNAAFPTADQQPTAVMRKIAAMKTFAFETTIDVLVRVQAADEDSARKAVPAVLGAPSTADVRLANENARAGLGIDAVIEDVKFNVAPDFDLVEVNGEFVNRRGEARGRGGVAHQRTISRADGLGDRLDGASSTRIGRKKAV